MISRVDEQPCDGQIMIRVNLSHNPFNSLFVNNKLIFYSKHTTDGE